MREMIQMGMATVVTESSRMKREIALALIYPTLSEGLNGALLPRQGAALHLSALFGKRILVSIEPPALSHRHP